MAISPFNNIEKSGDSDIEDLLKDQDNYSETDEAEVEEQESVDVAEMDVPFGANLAEVLDERILLKIVDDLDELITEDDRSRDEWKKIYEQGMVLLGLNYEDRTEPFEGSTGVTHPILNEAVTQFQAQAYKELLPAGGPVRTQIIGKVTPEQIGRASCRERVCLLV